MARIGRPTAYKPRYCREIAEYCSTGFSLAAFAAEISVNRDTINEWADRYPEFSEAVKRAKLLATRAWELRAQKLADNGGTGGQTAMVIFALKNMSPDDWRDRQELNVNVGVSLDALLQTAEERAAAAKDVTSEASAPRGIQTQNVGSNVGTALPAPARVTKSKT